MKVKDRAPCGPETQGDPIALMGPQEERCPQEARHQGTQFPRKGVKEPSLPFCFTAGSGSGLSLHRLDGLPSETLAELVLASVGPDMKQFETGS